MSAKAGNDCEKMADGVGEGGTRRRREAGRRRDGGQSRRRRDTAPKRGGAAERVGKGGARLRREAGQQRDGGQCWRRRDTTTAKVARPRRRWHDCEERGTAKRWRTVLAKAGHDGEGGTTTAEAGHDCEERGTAKRWRTVSAKAGHDAEERRDSDEERRDSDEERRDSEDVVVNDVDDAKGLGTQRWSWLVEESKSCAATSPVLDKVNGCVVPK